jgi:hypothetical protein
LKRKQAGQAAADISSGGTPSSDACAGSSSSPPWGSRPAACHSASRRQVSMVFATRGHARRLCRSPRAPPRASRRSGPHRFTRGLRRHLRRSRTPSRRGGSRGSGHRARARRSPPRAPDVAPSLTDRSDPERRSRGGDRRAEGAALAGHGGPRRRHGIRYHCRVGRRDGRARHRGPRRVRHGGARRPGGPREHRGRWRTDACESGGPAGVPTAPHRAQRTVSPPGLGGCPAQRGRGTAPPRREGSGGGGAATRTAG